MTEESKQTQEIAPSNKRLDRPPSKESLRLKAALGRAMEETDGKSYFDSLKDSIVVHDKEVDMQVEERANEIASIDELTGLLSKEGFKEAVTNLTDQQPDDVMKCMVVMDVDNFKKVNDELGHDLGDEVLAQIAHLVGGVFRTDHSNDKTGQERPADIIGRYGGDEFQAMINIANLDDINIDDPVAFSLYMREALKARYDKAIEDAVSSDNGLLNIDPSLSEEEKDKIMSTLRQINFSIGAVFLKNGDLKDQGLSKFFREADQLCLKLKRLSKLNMDNGSEEPSLAI